MSKNSVSDRAIRLVDYLTRLAYLRVTTIRDVAEYSQILWIHEIPQEKNCFTQAWGANEEYDDDIWLEIQTTHEPEIPSIPEICRDWINSDTLRNTNCEPNLLSTIIKQEQNPAYKDGTNQPQFLTKTIRLEDNPKVQIAWNKYVQEKWSFWAKEHKKWEKVHYVYSILFSIHQEQIRLGEEYELVLGLGLLTWQMPNNQRARRHLVVANALLEFEARLGKFTVRPNFDGANLRVELDMLDIEEQPLQAEQAAKETLESAADNPWNKDCMEGVLKGLVHSINPLGEYYDSLETKKPQFSEKPIVEYAPALILRKRSITGLTEILKRIKNRIEAGEHIPSEFCDLAEIPKQNDAVSPEFMDDSATQVNSEIYFPKPSNEEQRRIIEKVQYANGILVQGPPGTGKSHTIANLICHLLATGQRILITAKTPRALKVLVGRLKQEEKSHKKEHLFDSKKEEEGLIPRELRSLCISLLGSGLEEKKSLETSVNAILQKNEQWNETRAQEEIEEREEDLQRLRQEKAEIENRLRAIRESETYTQNIADGAYRGTAAKIARAVASDSDKYSWFTDKIAINTEYSLSEAELFRLLKELRVLTPEKKKELGYSWPDSVPTTSQFENLVKIEQQAILQENNTSKGINKRFFEDLSHCPEQIVRSIHEFLLQLLNEIHRLKSRPYKWIPDAIRDVLSENTAIWQELHKKSASIISQITKIVPKVDPIEITLPEGHNLKSVLEDALRLKEHLGHGGKLGWGPFCPKLVKSVRYIIRTIHINGRPCNNLDRVTSLAAVLHVRVNLEQGCSLWGGRFEKTQGPYSIQFRLFKDLTETLNETLLLRDKANQCKEALKQYNILFEPVWSDEDCLQTLMLTCEHMLARINRQKTENEINQVESPIATIARRSDFHPVVKDLLEAIKLRNVDSFACARSKIDDLDREKASALWVHETLQRLSEVAPNLSENLSRNCADACWNERIQQMHKAWRWAQARNWLEEYICKDDMSSLVQREQQITNEIGKTIAQIASLRAWSFCFSRMNDNHRRHMELWRQNISKITKSGRGKYDNWRRRAAQKNLNECREAVPAWVMPLHRVWDTVDPSPGMFDVIVVDEASQCGFEALPLFFLGKKILIVGDDKQISPDPVGIELGQVYYKLMEKYLYDFKFKDSFALENSLFDHGKSRYGARRIALREHFRCMPEIIRFSNDLCYSDTPLIPLRQYPPNRLPPLIHVYIQNGYREGSDSRVINRPEAEAIVKKIIELCHNVKYEDKTMGVIVLQGESQAKIIETQLFEQLGAEEIERRRIVCGNPYSFQGDERDIIFLSMVAAPNERIVPFAKPADMRRFNVAASRARDQMWLFHSVTQNDLSGTDLRRQLLMFFEENKIQEIAGINVKELTRQTIQANRSVVKPPDPFESWFELDVALEIASRGYRVIPQFAIAGKYIDLVIEGGQGRLAVECDGDEWHGAERYEQDMQRQRILERCGLVFYRIRESSFYTDKEDALKRLWLLLEEREIFPQRVSPCNGSVEDETTSENRVEVGDTVEYRDEEEPDLELQAMITRDPSNPELGAINFCTPIAQAMLGSSVEQVVEVRLPIGRKYLRIIKIKKKLSQA